ncbi:MAG: HIT domain-containing protein [Kiritimatiellae bacterium]|nr:HIT domain-containing protein [Kiritimatiellia bacterium]
MKQIWAPWRIDYILQAKEEGCFLCDILQQEDDRTNLVLKRGETCAIIMNKYPYNNAHLMVAPYGHTNKFEMLHENETSNMMIFVQEAIQRLNSFMHPEGYNIGINLGEAAGAGLKEHIHTHIVPRWDGDTNFMPVLAETKVIPQSLHELWDQLYPLFNT